MALGTEDGERGRRAGVALVAGLSYVIASVVVELVNNNWAQQFLVASPVSELPPVVWLPLFGAVFFGCVGLVEGGVLGLAISGPKKALKYGCLLGLAFGAGGVIAGEGSLLYRFLVGIRWGGPVSLGDFAAYLATRGVLIGLTAAVVLLRASGGGGRNMALA